MRHVPSGVHSKFYMLSAVGFLPVLTRHQYRCRTMRTMQKTLSYDMCQPTAASQTGAWLWLDMCALLSQARRQSRRRGGWHAGWRRCSSPCSRHSIEDYARPWATKEGEAGIRPGSKGRRNASQALQNVAFQIFWVSQTRLE